VAFWKEYGPLVRPGDLPALNRLWIYRDQLARALDEFGKAPLVEMKNGRMMVNPIAQVVSKWERAVCQLEASFALTPLARMKLGVTVAEGQSLASRNAALRARHEGEK
jgi:phage terminase small subunit